MTTTTITTIIVATAQKLVIQCRYEKWFKGKKRWLQLGSRYKKPFMELDLLQVRMLVWSSFLQSLSLCYRGTVHLLLYCVAVKAYHNYSLVFLAGIIVDG